MSLEILQYPNITLAKPSLEIQKITPELCRFAKEMVETMYLAEGVGLAAPQVGKNIRLIVVDVSGPERRDDLKILFNPKIIPVQDAGFIEREEGCLSVADYRAKVKRYAQVFLEAFDSNGDSISFEAEGLLAVCLQHEIDHLDGKLFIDRISRLKHKFYDNRREKQGKSNN